jgi:hypothetical protein
VFKDLGVDRKYEIVDASVHPYDVVKDVVQKVTKELQKLGKIQFDPKKALEYCEELISNGDLQDFELAWQAQYPDQE